MTDSIPIWKISDATQTIVVEASSLIPALYKAREAGLKGSINIVKLTEKEITTDYSRCLYCGCIIDSKGNGHHSADCPTLKESK